MADTPILTRKQIRRMTCKLGGSTGALQTIEEAVALLERYIAKPSSTVVLDDTRAFLERYNR